ncbi:hypothetical protein OG885_01450 [Streptomyces sp. NBC_00028]|uniref:hypothetical protein n=1 Tax=Streptomyces sp. NBC_00028 TaxID=2975624 RepID=UPI0032496BE4
MALPVAMAMATMVAFVGGCTSSKSTDGKSGSAPSATPSPVSFPSSPPDAAQCRGTVLDHRDIKHPDLGTVRVFLVRRADSNPLPGCVASVTGSGQVLKTLDVEVYENELRFADPASDATKNTFVIYNPGRYDGVLILVPAKDGFEDIGWTDQENHYLGGKLAYYHARLAGPGGDSRYTIVRSANSCDPSCAEGATSKVTLHWNGRAYLPTE